MYNKETVIRLNTLDDVQEFVGAASKCDFDIDLKYRQILIDAKSLLGVIGIGTNNDFGRVSSLSSPFFMFSVLKISGVRLKILPEHKTVDIIRNM